MLYYVPVSYFFLKFKSHDCGQRTPQSDQNKKENVSRHSGLDFVQMREVDGAQDQQVRNDRERGKDGGSNRNFLDR